MDKYSNTENHATTMQNTRKLAQMLEAYDVPAILVTADYQITASNSAYQQQFGAIELRDKPKCFAVSHGYRKPCDQEGEDCPLLAATQSGKKEKVLHIHQTPNGREHVDVEMIPVFGDDDQLEYFVELLRPVPLASGKTSKQKMIGSSPAFSDMLQNVTRVAESDVSVLLQGESGTGKELISHAIHLGSRRRDRAMVTLECAGLSETLIESELFGHKKGSFTGANSDKVGLVEHADGGTLFLDEIGDVSLATQVKLLRLIESKTFRRVGSTEVRTSDFRLICATHRDLTKMVEQGQFRHDLYYRINVFPIHVPPLRERRSDIPSLVEHMLAQEERQLHITESAQVLLQRQDYPGNIRELRNLVSRATVLCETNLIDKEVIQSCIDIDASAGDPPDPQSPGTTLKQLEYDYLRELMQRYGNDKALVAEAADISVRTLYRKLEAMDKESTE